MLSGCQARVGPQEASSGTAWSTPQLDSCRKVPITRPTFPVPSPPDAPPDALCSPPPQTSRCGVTCKNPWDAMLQLWRVPTRRELVRDKASGVAQAEAKVVKTRMAEQPDIRTPDGRAEDG